MQTDTHARATRRRQLGITLFIVALIAGLLYLRSNHLDGRLYYWAKTHWHGEQWQDRALWLPDYRATVEALPVRGIAVNLSGLAFDPDLGILWAVTNNPSELYAISREGELKGRFALEGFDDVEGLAYAGNGQLIIGEERRHTVQLVPVPANTDGTLLAKGALQRHRGAAVTLPLGETDNKGLEGLGFDQKTGRLFAVRERDPVQLIAVHDAFTHANEDPTLELRDLSHWVQRRVFATDISAVEFAPRHGHLLLLSDQSKRLVELTEQGDIVSYLSLRRGAAGLQADIPQPEGLALDDHDNLYIVSEPNLFYRFEPQR